MRIRYKSFILLILFTQIILLDACKKAAEPLPFLHASNIKIYNNDSILFPIAVVAGDNNILCAYGSYNAKVKIMITDFSGNILSEKQIDVLGGAPIDFTYDGNDHYSLFNYFKYNISSNADTFGFKSLFFTNAGLIDKYLSRALSDGAGNYYIMGTNIDMAYPSGFFIKTDSMGYELLSYQVPSINQTFQSVTGMCPAFGGGYMLLTSVCGSPATVKSCFKLIKLKENGTLDWMKIHFASSNSYYATSLVTNSIFQTSDGNYMCFINDSKYVPYPRAYKVNPDGDVIDSVNLNFGRLNVLSGQQRQFQNGFYSAGYGVAQDENGNFLISLQNDTLSQTLWTNTVHSQIHSSTIKMDQNLNVTYNGNIQHYQSDCFNSVARLKNGKLVVFGMIDINNKGFHPALIFE